MEEDIQNYSPTVMFRIRVLSLNTRKLEVLVKCQLAFTLEPIFEDLSYFLGYSFLIIKYSEFWTKILYSKELRYCVFSRVYPIIIGNPASRNSILNKEQSMVLMDSEVKFEANWSRCSRVRTYRQTEIIKSYLWLKFIHRE